ncbi:hypothetical protein Fcan01_24146 [Folsomia candida]|uniref:Uncharacterized protein n=1 Tax=Folsomia candida TaxID=158441 RepID=A0A226D8V1_FOLCA|nr:hypothetical protein Fcan01_24146 [Folsomia candida]
MKIFVPGPTVKNRSDLIWNPMPVENNLPLRTFDKTDRRSETWRSSQNLTEVHSSPSECNKRLLFKNKLFASLYNLDCNSISAQSSADIGGKPPNIRIHIQAKISPSNIQTSISKKNFSPSNLQVSISIKISCPPYPNIHIHMDIYMLKSRPPYPNIRIHIHIHQEISPSNIQTSISITFSRPPISKYPAVPYLQYQSTGRALIASRIFLREGNNGHHPPIPTHHPPAVLS